MSDKVKEEIKAQIAKLQDINVDELTDEDLEDVAGGCSNWCCSDGRSATIAAE